MRAHQITCTHPLSHRHPGSASSDGLVRQLIRSEQPSLLQLSNKLSHPQQERARQQHGPKKGRRELQKGRWKRPRMVLSPSPSDRASIYYPAPTSPPAETTLTDNPRTYRRPKPRPTRRPPKTPSAPPRKTSSGRRARRAAARSASPRHPLYQLQHKKRNTS